MRFDYESGKIQRQEKNLSPLHATPCGSSLTINCCYAKTVSLRTGNAVKICRVERCFCSLEKEGARANGPKKLKLKSRLELHKKFFSRPILTALCLLSVAVLPLPCAAGKPIMVHYMPWFVSQPFSGYWGWHWTMNHYNPSVVDGSGRAQIASWYYPQIGPYDSADPAVLEYHVLLMKLGGVDGVIVDWYGIDNFNDYAVNNQRTQALLKYTAKAGLKFSLCYEDATIQNEINGGFTTSANAIARAQQTFLSAQTNYFNTPGYLRISGAPVLLNFGPQYFKNSSDWTSIFSVLSATNQPKFYTEDNRLSMGAGAFNWPPMWMTGGGSNLLTSLQLQSYLTTFEQNAAGWPGYVSSAFPRFHDIYSQAGVGSSYGILDDASGLNLTNTLKRALTNNSAVVQIVTWNDFGEGTVVEPTVEYGYRDLGIIQDFRRQYVEPGFAYHTNDLNLALRIYNLRRQYAASPAINAELDRVFTNVISGALSTASLQVTGIESNRLVIYGLSCVNTQFQFNIGGNVAAGATVQMSTNLSSWQSVQVYPGTTNLMTFGTSTTQSVCRFFKVQ
jgi:hypothetical protein